MKSFDQTIYEISQIYSFHGGNFLIWNCHFGRRYSCFMDVFILCMQESSIDGADDDESGFLKLIPTQEWIDGESDSAPMNKKALAKVCHLFLNVVDLFLSLTHTPFGFDCRHCGMTAREGRN